MSIIGIIFKELVSEVTYTKQKYDVKGKSSVNEVHRLSGLMLRSFTSVCGCFSLDAIFTYLTFIPGIKQSFFVFFLDKNMLFSMF